mmetsp:Transcript_17895/g.20385  ORF Transcript_17895/g.20385 Transcript_17895/m.20385 type:complete len:659 (+) Transcript_17895:211-2187(+)
MANEGDVDPRNVAGSEDENDDDNAKPSKSGKSRRELPSGAVATLKAWLLSPEHFTHPYPTPQDQLMLMQKTGIDKKQLKNWFTNARRRIWKPMLKKQLEQGKIAQTGSGAVVALPPGVAINSAPPIADYTTVVDHTQAMQQNYQRAIQQPQNTQQQLQYDSYGNPIYQSQQQQQQQQAPPPQQTVQYNNYDYNQQNQYSSQQQEPMAQSTSIGSLPQMPGATPPGSISHLNKTDSHAVLMELFARDQDLVRQATEGAKQRMGSQNGSGDQSPYQGQNGLAVGNPLGSQHPMNKMGGGQSSFSKLGNVPSLNSWPHFSSVSSLNNLGTMTGVKSITNMSTVELVKEGSVNHKGNIAQVKSIENMGRADSFAFLEVFFDNANTNSNLIQTQRGIKREREEDDNVGLCLDGDEQSSPSNNPPMSSVAMDANNPSGDTSLPCEGQDKESLKRAYDDALAARGLISVSRSSEKLSDLALPTKMQRTISQEYLKNINSGAPTAFSSFSFNTNLSQGAPNPILPHPGQSALSQPNQQRQNNTSQMSPQSEISSQTQQQQIQASLNTGSTNASVEVPSTTKCSLCHCINVDTQLRPCGHMFHGRCLRPSLQNAVGPPKCPIDNITMQSAVLAVPTDENSNNIKTVTSTTNYTAAPIGSQVTNTSSV